MNQVITEGLQLMPPAFAEGLAQWSREDGRPNQDTYATAANAALVAADADFGTCLEIVKIESTTRLRFTGETPIRAGLYLQIRARIKLISGTAAVARIGAWAGSAANTNIAGVAQFGPTRAVDTFGEVVELSAIVGVGARTGVDMVWGGSAVFGHFGIDIIGDNGGVFRIEDIEITDATDIYYRELMDWVDVTDFGAIGDGITDSRAAFAAADQAAQGREILVPAGVYFIGSTLGLDARVRFEGRVVMPDAARLALNQNFDLNGYADAFGDAELGLRKGIQTLLNQSDFEGFDLNARRVILTEPLDVQAAVGNRTTYANRRVLRNGQLTPDNSPAWDDDFVVATAQWSVNDPRKLTNIANVAQIPVGSLVTGAVGVGREVYVRARDIAAGTITLSLPLGVPPQTQSYGFRRFKYLLDFSGFQNLQRFVITDIEFLCADRASAIMLPIDGLVVQVQDCFFTGPKDRGITSPGEACQGLKVERCQFLSKEQAERVEDRVSIAININSNDAKIRDNRVVKFRHFMLAAGTGYLISGNHFFQGDGVPNGVRSAGLIFTGINIRSTVNGNYIDNCSIEWINEHDPAPELSSELSFGALTINDNIFMSIRSAPWFSFLVIRPQGPGHYINALSICDNSFKHIQGAPLERVDAVDSSVAPLDGSRTKNFLMQGNTFHGIVRDTQNPVTLAVTENSPQQVWEVDLRDWLPFEGQARVAASALPEGPLRNSANVVQYVTPYATTRHGVGRGSIRLNWSQPVRGTVQLTARCDTP
jgi:hypothetical protein